MPTDAKSAAAPTKPKTLLRIALLSIIKRYVLVREDGFEYEGRGGFFCDATNCKYNDKTFYGAWHFFCSGSSLEEKIFAVRRRPAAIWQQKTES